MRYIEQVIKYIGGVGPSKVLVKTCIGNGENKPSCPGQHTPIDTPRNITNEDKIIKKRTKFSKSGWGLTRPEGGRVPLCLHCLMSPCQLLKIFFSSNSHKTNIRYFSIEQEKENKGKKYVLVDASKHPHTQLKLDTSYNL